MKRLEVEAWAMKTLEAVEAKAQVEDARIELKRDWILVEKMARRLAGHANAIRGENILWLIGVDEKQNTVTGATPQDLANWYPQLQSCFDDETPGLVYDIVVHHSNKTVVALYFDTSRFPYVVKNPQGGEIHREVPWREGTAVRSAKRRDLVGMLAPLVNAPKLELLEGTISLDDGKDQRVMPLPCFEFNLSVYVVPLSKEPLWIPRHKCTAQILANNTLIADSFDIRFETARARAEQRHNSIRAFVERVQSRGASWPTAHLPNLPDIETNEATQDELLIRGAGKVFLLGSHGPAQRFGGQDELELRFIMTEAVSDLPLIVSGQFTRIKDSDSAKDPNRWGLKKP